MGLFSGITDTLFGGVDKSAQKAQKQANAEAIEYTKLLLGQQIPDAQNLFSLGQYGANRGFGGAADMLSQGYGTSQNQLLGGMGQYQNAIMGLPMNNNAIQAGQMGYDPRFFDLPTLSPQEQFLPSHYEPPQGPQGNWAAFGESLVQPQQQQQQAGKWLGGVF